MRRIAHGAIRLGVNLPLLLLQFPTVPTCSFFSCSQVLVPIQAETVPSHSLLVNCGPDPSTVGIAWNLLGRASSEEYAEVVEQPNTSDERKNRSLPQVRCYDTLASVLSGGHLVSCTRIRRKGLHCCCPSMSESHGSRNLHTVVDY